MLTNRILKGHTITLLASVICSVALIFQACTEDPVTGGNSNNQQTTGTYLSAPTGVRAEVIGRNIVVSWNTVSQASRYEVYVYREYGATSNGYETVGRVNTGTSFTERPVYNGTYYYKVKSVGANGNESDFSLVASCTFTGGEPYGDGDQPDGDEEPGDDDSSGQPLPPDAPTGVQAENRGNDLLPEVRISWNAVTNATGYKVYRSKNASGTYSQIGSETSFTFLSDFSPYKGTNYYKVKAVNESGESQYSSFATFRHDTETATQPCTVQYGNCTVSGYMMTLRWTVPTPYGCGKPNRAYLRVRNPISGDYTDVQTLSGTATSASFNYTEWVDNNGYIYVGIITENAKGTSGGSPKIYDNKNKRWMN